MADTPETKRQYTPEQFAQETWLKPAPDVWRPINTTPQQLAELKEQIKNLGEPDRTAKAKEFIERHQVSFDWLDYMANAMATAAVESWTVDSSQRNALEADIRAKATMGTATAWVGAEVWSMLKDATWEAMAEVKKPWFWKGHMGDFMKEALEGMLEAKKEGGIMGFLAGFGLMFLKPFAKKLWLSEEQLKELGIDSATTTAPLTPTPESARTQVEQWPKDIVIKSTARYFLRKTHERWYDGLWSAVWKWAKDAWNSDETNAKKEIEKEANVILGWKGLANKTYKEIIAYKDDPDIATKLGLTGLDTKTKVPALRLAVNALAVNQDHIQELIWWKYTNWRELPLHAFLENFYAYTGMATVTKVADIVKDIDLTDPNKYKDAIRKLAISPNSDGSLSGYVGEKLGAYKSQWIDEEVVRRIVVPGTEWEQTVSSFRATLTNSKFGNDVAQQKMQEITTKDAFPKSVVWLMDTIWLNQFTGNLNNGEEITMEELLMVYVITGWEGKMDALSQSQQNELIPVLYAIAARKNPAEFAVNKAIDFINSPTNQYVKRMADFVGTAMSDAAYIATFQSVGLTLDSAQALLKLRDDPNPEKSKYFWYIMGVIGLWVGSILFLRKPVLSVFLTFTTISLIAKGAGLSLAAK